MKPTFISKYTTEDLYDTLLKEAGWQNRNSCRQECFMSSEGAPKVYSYGNNNEHRQARHTYEAESMHPKVLELMLRINEEFNTEYNVCVLNYYSDEKQHLGWHSDNSPEQDLSHPIAVIAFGAERYIWTKKLGATGQVPLEDRYLLTKGSMFVMPGGYQSDYLHRIPKHDSICGGRISLTFRKLLR